MPDLVNHPPHYTRHPSGVEAIQITEHMGFNLGNAMKYIWRADEKGAALEDLRKAAWYVNREIERREKSVTADGLIVAIDGAGVEHRQGLNKLRRAMDASHGEEVRTLANLPPEFLGDTPKPMR